VTAGRGRGGASKWGRTPIRAAVLFLCHEIYKDSVSSVAAGNGHGWTNHVRRTMHSLDVASSVSKSSKCTEIVGGWGFAPDPTGELTALPIPAS